LAQYSKGQYNNAIIFFRLCTEKNNKHLDAHQYLSKILAKLGEENSALQLSHHYSYLKNQHTPSAIDKTPYLQLY